jgi:inner membrane protein YidH
VSTEPGGPAAANTGRDLAGLQAELALLRTRLAVERTLMATVRSALGLITFGIVLFEFVEYLRSRLAAADWPSRDVVRDIGIGMMALAIGLLVAGLVSGHHMSRRLHERWNELRDRGQIPPADRMPLSFVPAVALLLLLVAILVIVRMIWRAGYFD